MSNSRWTGQRRECPARPSVLVATRWATWTMFCSKATQVQASFFFSCRACCMCRQSINISERKSVKSAPTRGRNWYFSTTSRHGTRRYPGYIYPVPSKAKHTQFYKQIHGTIKWWSCVTKYTVSESCDVPGCNDNYVAGFAGRISFAEQWKLVAAEQSAFFPTLNAQKDVTF